MNSIISNFTDGFDFRFSMKWIAPKLIKLASIPNIYIIDNVKSKANGITEATTIPDLKLPNNRITTKTTIIIPKIKFADKKTEGSKSNKFRNKNEKKE